MMMLSLMMMVMMMVVMHSKDLARINMITSMMIRMIIFGADDDEDCDVDDDDVDDEYCYCNGGDSDDSGVSDVSIKNC